MEIDVDKLRQCATANKLMNCYTLKLTNATVQVFLVSRRAMCFVRKSKVLPNVSDYGLVVKSSRLVTSVYTSSLLSKVCNMNKFYRLCKSAHSNLSILYEPEIFPCIHMKCFDVTMRLFHTGKVILLGVKSPNQLAEPLRFLSDVYFDYTLAHNFDNI